MNDTAWLPNFFIAGAPKAGTSSMHAWIADHPDAQGSREKETYFFVDPGTHMYRPDAHISRGLESYRAQFKIRDGAAPSVVLESTPAYIYSTTALARIPDLASRPKCLFMLREPSAQIYSLYTYFRDNWNWIPQGMSFAEFVLAARRGDHGFNGNELAQRALVHANYADYLVRWRERLGAERMMVTTFDEVVADHRAVTQRIAAWLGLDASFYDAYAFPRENETYAPRNRLIQRLNVGIRSFLPRGGAYEKLRHVYRKLNTKKPLGPTEEERAEIERLRLEFLEPNARLSTEFGLQLHSWQKRG